VWLHTTAAAGARTTTATTTTTTLQSTTTTLRLRCGAMKRAGNMRLPVYRPSTQMALSTWYVLALVVSAFVSWVSLGSSIQVYSDGKCSKSTPPRLVRVLEVGSLPASSFIACDTWTSRLIAVIYAPRQKHREQEYHLLL
jgi:hypothetical protein